MTSDFANWFVNREKQYLGFQKMLAGETERVIMRIEAPAEMGKTWLLQMMRRHAEEKGLPVMHVDFRDRRPHDFLSLVRLARDQMGGPFFNELTATINKFTGVNVTIATAESAPSSVGVSAQGDVSIQGDVAGGDIIKDNHFFIQADTDIVRRAAEFQINDAFFDALRALLGAQPKAVFLFDSVEDITSEAERWLHDYLLLRMREGQAPNALVVIAGREVPNLGPEFKPLVASTGLEMFSEAHVREYIQERRQIADLDVGTVFRTSGGFPGLLAKMADLAVVDLGDDEDWL